MFTPTTNLRLLSTPLQSDYKNTLWFPNRETQTNYFLGKTVKTFTNFNYIKKNNTIVVEGEVDLYYNCNYIMYQNANFTNKWFYAFIDRIEWASNNSVRLFVTTDCIQTWFFDITYYQSYVDRCHSDTDVAGDNIVPEDFSGVANGGYFQVGTQDLTPNKLVIFSTTYTDGSPLETKKINGIFSGSGYLTDPIDISSSVATVNTWLGTMVRQGLANAVSRVQQYPDNHDVNATYDKHPDHLDCVGNSGRVTYIPQNKKLLSGAFLTAYVTLYGQEMEFNPEYIAGTKINVSIGVDQTTGTVGAIVNNYSNPQIPVMCITAVIPESTWAYNQYKNDYNLHSASNSMYQARAGINRTRGQIANTVSGAQNTIGAISNTLGIAQGIWNAANIFDTVPVATSLRNVAGSASGLVGNIGGVVDSVLADKIYGQGIDEITQDLTAIAENYNAPAVGGVASSNIYLSLNKTAMSYGFKVPPLDITKRFDKYLTVYGYKQSEYRTINLHARTSWTYIKTVGLNADGNFPDNDMNVIKRAFNNGIFFWAYTATYGNFDQNNSIV